MSIKEAFTIVLDLATQNVIEDPDMKEEKDKQEKAIDLVQEYVSSLR